MSTDQTPMANPEAELQALRAALRAAEAERDGFREECEGYRETVADWKQQFLAREAAESQVTALRGALEWQPIETAPKDGTRFIGLKPNRNVEVVHWSTKYRPSAWATDEEFYLYPTHWMPLPAPPASGPAPDEPEGV